MFAEKQCEECGTCFLRCHYVDCSREKVIQQIRALQEANDGDTLKGCITWVACNEYCAQKHGADAMVFLCVGCYWLMSGLCEVRGLSSLFITDLSRMALF